jgi:hypothetical protein
MPLHPALELVGFIISKFKLWKLEKIWENGISNLGKPFPPREATRAWSFKYLGSLNAEENSMERSGSGIGKQQGTVHDSTPERSGVSPKRSRPSPKRSRVLQISAASGLQPPAPMQCHNSTLSRVNSFQHVCRECSRVTLSFSCVFKSFPQKIPKFLQVFPSREYVEIRAGHIRSSRLA